MAYDELFAEHLKSTRQINSPTAARLYSELRGWVDGQVDFDTITRDTVALEITARQLSRIADALERIAKHE